MSTLPNYTPYYGGGQVKNPANVLQVTGAPSTTLTEDRVGTLAIDTTNKNGYILVAKSGGIDTWYLFGGSSAGISQVNADSGHATPSGGAVTMAGTANQLSTSGSGSTITYALSATLTAPGSLTVTNGFTVSAGTSSIKALTAVGTASINASGAGVTTIGTGGTGAVNIGNATGNTAVTGSLTASTGLVATTGGITASAGGAAITGTTNINTSGSAVTTIGTGGTGAVNIGNGTGNTFCTGTFTANNGILASSGNLSTTNGNLSLGTAGNKILITTGSNASVGTSGVMSGTPGAVTVATTACSATAKIFYSRATTGGTPGNVSITAQDGTGFTLTSTGNETSTFNWWIINN